MHSSPKERDLIEEHDIAVFTLGNFERCIVKYKPPLYKDLAVPVIVTGGPELGNLEGARGYVGGIGRYPERARTGDMIDKLRAVSELAGKVIEERRRELDLDPLVMEPTVVKDEVERQIPEAKEALSPNPVTLKIDGVRIKLQYDDYKDRVSDIVINGKRLGEFAVVKRSQMRDYILVKILPASMFQ